AVSPDGHASRGGGEIQSDSLRRVRSRRNPICDKKAPPSHGRDESKEWRAENPLRWFSYKPGCSCSSLSSMGYASFSRETYRISSASTKEVRQEQGSNHYPEYSECIGLDNPF